MTTTNCKTAKQAANEILTIAKNYAFVYECPWIATDMAIYAENHIKAYAEAMKTEGKFSYTEHYYIRHRGVEANEKRVAELGDTTIAVVTVKYDKKANAYTIEKVNR